MTPALPPTDPSGQDVQTPRGPLHVVDEGPKAGPAVVMLHGIPGSVRDFRYLGPALAAQGVRAIRVDLPGFGGSPLSACPSPKNATRAAVVMAAIDALGVEQVVWLGHSMGAAVALFGAGLFPARTAGFVAVNGVGVERHHSIRFFPRTLMRLVQRTLVVEEVRSSVIEVLRAVYAKMGFPAPEQYSDEALLHHLRLVANMDFAQQRWAARQVRCPSLIFTASDDPMVEPRIGSGLHEALSAAAQTHVHRHINFPTGGHVLLKTEVQHVAAEVSSWIQA